MPQEVLLFTQNVQEAKKEIVAHGGYVTHQFTDRVMVANLPESVNLQSLQHSTTTPPSSLDSASQLAADAWNNLQAKKRQAPAPNPTEGLSWDAPGFEPPRTRVDMAGIASKSDMERSTGTPTSLSMVGSIAVGVVLVSGTQNDLSLASAEQSQIIQEVQEALNFLANVEPRATITFVYDIHLVTVDVESNPDPHISDPYEQWEAPWRNAALGQMGYSSSIGYVQTLRTNSGTDWAYVAYFTKYPLHWFAYAGGERLVMNYANDNWGSHQINRVFAHETCHIFGAADEYGSCKCDGSHGQFQIPNNNCINCPGTHVPCLMDANVLTLCEWTRGQIGWVNLPPPKSSNALSWLPILLLEP